MRVLIGGGSGFIGSAVSRLLRSKGHDVLVVSRTTGQGKITWAELKDRGLPECSAVVSLSGENVLNPLKRWTDSFKTEVQNSRIETTRALADAINKTQEKPKVFVTMSGVGFYKPSLEAEYTEDSPGGDADFFAKLCQQWEDAGRQAKDVRHVIVRTGVVLGKDGGAMQQMIWPFWFGVGGKIGSGRQYFPWIHISDIAGIFVHALESEDVVGVLNGVAPGTVTNSGFTKALGSALWRPTVFPLPGFVVNTMFGSERGVMLLDGQKVIPKRTLESGYQFEYPDIDAAMKNIVG
ncbi:epimerase family protein SDR39U1-like [Ptychodera flava]|uniref:epimerase family protein SDR39U1-like n=1 Tax=Ptychodera flava TaxID=63121 RepID=UPI00396A991A